MRHSAHALFAEKGPFVQSPVDIEEKFWVIWGGGQGFPKQEAVAMALTPRVECRLFRGAVIGNQEIDERLLLYTCDTVSVLVS